MLKNKIEKIKKFILKNNNDINIPIFSDFLEWFYEKLNLHFFWIKPRIKFKKWEIYFVNLWKNIWTELNKIRPCLIYSKKSFNSINWIVIIPFKSYNWKKIIEKFQIKIEKSHINNLRKSSICDIFHIKYISTKRLKWKVWIIENKYLEEIDKKVLLMFDIKIKDEK